MAAQNSTDEMSGNVFQQPGDGSFAAGGLLDDPSLQTLSGEDYLNALPDNAAPLIPLIKAYAQGTVPLPSDDDMRDPRLLRLIQMAGQYDPSLSVAGFTSRAAAANNALSGAQQGLDGQPDPGNRQPVQPQNSSPPPNFQSTMGDGSADLVVAPAAGALTGAQIQNVLNPPLAPQLGRPNLPRLQTAPSNLILPDPSGFDDTRGGLLGQTGNDALASGILGNGPALSFGGLLGDANTQNGSRNGGSTNNVGNGLFGGDWLSAAQPPNKWTQMSAKTGQGAGSNGSGNDGGMFVNNAAIQNSFSAPASGNPAQGLTPFQRAAADQRAAMGLDNGISIDNGQGAGSNGSGNDGGMFVNDSAIQNSFSAPASGNPAQGLTPFQRAAADQRAAMGLADGFGTANQPTDLSNGIQQALDNLHAIKGAPSPAKAGATQASQTPDANKTYWNDAIGNFLPPTPDLSDVTLLGDNLTLPRSVTNPTLEEKLESLRKIVGTPQWQAFRDTISQTERANYNSLNTGVPFNNAKKFDPTKDRYPGQGAGIFQITHDTYNDYSKKLGITDKNIKPETQNLIAAQMVIDSGAMPDILNGDIAAALPKIYQKWESLPDGPDNRGYKANQKPHSFDFVVKTFNDALTNARANAQPPN